MTTFSVTQLVQSSVLYIYSTKDKIEIDPEYQRMGDVWTLDKRQLLIDSILNEFDIPRSISTNSQGPLLTNGISTP